MLRVVLNEEKNSVISVISVIFTEFGGVISRFQEFEEGSIWKGLFDFLETRIFSEFSDCHTAHRASRP
jgi:hypothetical protein